MGPSMPTPGESGARWRGAAAALLSAGVLMMAPTIAVAEDPGACGKFKWSVAREQAALAGPDIVTVASGDSLPGPGTAASIKLLPQTSVAFARAPARKPKADPAFAAILTLAAVAKAGTYQVTLSDEAWIDVLQDGKEIRSAGFSGQPDCPGIRKSVKFPLAAGSVTVQISGASVDHVKLDVLPAQ